MAFSRVSSTLLGVVTGDGTVTDVKVASNAAIAFSKLAPLTSGSLLIGNASNVPTAVAISGDATISNTGVLSIAAGAVITADLADSAVTTAKINNAAVTAAKVDTTGVAVLGTAQQYTRTHNFTATTLTDGATINWDLSQNQVASVTLAGNRTLANPTNLVNGAVYILIVRQDATGGRTLSFSSAYKFAGGTAPTLTTTASKADIMTFVCDGTNMYGVSALNC